MISGAVSYQLSMTERGQRDLEKTIAKMNPQTASQFQVIHLHSNLSDEVNRIRAIEIEGEWPGQSIDARCWKWRPRTAGTPLWWARTAISDPGHPKYCPTVAVRIEDRPGVVDAEDAVCGARRRESWRSG